MSEKEELMPCPFCGGAVEVFGDPTDVDFGCYKIWCDSCMLAMESFGSNKADLIATWNTRTKVPAGGV